MNVKLRKTAIITGICMGMFTGAANLYAEEYPSEWDAESEERTYITDDDGTKYYVIDEFAAEWNAETATEEESSEGQETAQETPETSQNSEEEEQTVNDELQAVKDELQAINSKLSTPILRSPANTQSYMGLDSNKTIYIYRIWSPSQNRWYYVGSNSGTIYIDVSEDSVSGMDFKNIYVEDGKQQALVFFENKKQAISDLWGYTTISSTNAEAARYLGAVFTNKAPFVQPYQFVTVIRRFREEEDSANGELWPAYFRNTFVRDNNAYLGTAEVTMDVTTWELIEVRQKQPFSNEDLYLIGGTITALLIIIIFKRGKH